MVKCKVKLNPVIIKISLFIIFLVTSCMLQTIWNVIICLGVVISMAITIYIAYAQNREKELSGLICVPVLLSAIQNIYLGIMSNHITSFELQVLLSVHIGYVFLSICIYVVLRGGKKWVLFIISLVFIYAIFSIVLNNTDITAAFSSIRNILSCILFWYFAYLYGKRADIDKVFDILLKIATFVVLFGFLEYFIGIELWKQLNIGQLWNTKGISTNMFGIPQNWFSSEFIRGHQVRRMVSSFADPVNLGTYLFAAFMLAWYKKKRVLMLLIVVACILSVSKGALLSFFVFFVVYFWYRDRTRILSPVSICVCGVAGVWFLNFTMKSSTGSTMYHMKKFLNSLPVLFQKPLGYGIGQSGVLSSLLSTSLRNTEINETGIGLLIAQMGVLGLSIYVFYFMQLYKLSSNLKQINNRVLVMYMSLIVAFIFNAVFNEVALSPNSCGMYFIIIGIVSSYAERKI